MPFKGELDLVVMLLAAALATAALSMRVAGQPTKHAVAEARRVGALELAVARVSANEGALQNLDEVSLIWQTVEGSAATTDGRLEFLRRHSPHVLGRKPCGGVGNCDWSSQLSRRGSIPAALAAGGTDPEWWDKVRRDRWLGVLSAAEALVAGRVLARPCSRTPVTWGSPVLDAAYARRHGLCRLHCGVPGGTLLNDGYAPC